MQQKETDIAIKINDKRQYDRIVAWLADKGFFFVNRMGTNNDPQEIWEKTTAEGVKIKALIVTAVSGTETILFADNIDLENQLKDWTFLDTADFKEAVELAVRRRGLADQPRSYRLKKDSVEVRAGAIVTWCDAGHYGLVTPDLRAYPEDSDEAFQHGTGICFSPKTVEEQPEWFERVYQLDQFVPENKYLDIQEQLKNGL